MKSQQQSKIKESKDDILNFRKSHMQYSKQIIANDKNMIQSKQILIDQHFPLFRFFNRHHCNEFCKSL